MRRARRGAALAASGLLATVILLAPWYALGEYEPNGWDASSWLRVAALLAVVNLAVVRSRGAGSLLLTSAAALLVGFRVLLPPDFGFDFDGLEVPVERRWGAWLGLVCAVAAVVAALVTRGRPGPRALPARGGWW